jgi:anti-anti-sigma regulatory factor
MTQSGSIIPTRIVLDQRLSIAQVAVLHGSLQEALRAGAPVTVDGSGVVEIDTAGLQLLVSLWLSSRALGIDCAWHGISEALRRTAALIGLTEALHFPVAESVGGRGDAVP